VREGTIGDLLRKLLVTLRHSDFGFGSVSTAWFALASLWGGTQPGAPGE